MPRRACVLLPGMSLHLIQRGNNRSACFYTDEREKGADLFLAHGIA